MLPGSGARTRQGEINTINLAPITAILIYKKKEKLISSYKCRDQILLRTLGGSLDSTVMASEFPCNVNI